MEKQSNSDARRRAKPITLTPGDKVLYQQPKRNKLTTPYNIKPYAVAKVNGSMVTATRDGHSITRNSSFFKKIISKTKDVPTVLDEEDERIVVNAVKPKYPFRLNRQRPSYLNDYELV